MQRRRRIALSFFSSFLLAIVIHLVCLLLLTPFFSMLFSRGWQTFTGEKLKIMLFKMIPSAQLKQNAEAKRWYNSSIWVISFFSINPRSQVLCEEHWWTFMNRQDLHSLNFSHLIHLNLMKFSGTKSKRRKKEERKTHPWLKKYNFCCCWLCVCVGSKRTPQRF